jgi:hypothetical protein
MAIFVQSYESFIEFQQHTILQTDGQTERVNQWKIILDACASQLQKDGSTGFLWLNGGTIPHTTPP